MPKKPAPKKRAATKAKAPAESPGLPLPPWTGKKPKDGVLAVPGTLKSAISKALGALDRRYSITRSVGMNAIPGPSGSWGLHRMLSVADGAGPDVARVFDVLAKHDLPIVAADFWYPSGSSGSGTVAGARAIFEAGLASKAVAMLHRLTVLLHQVNLEPPIAQVLADAVGRMPSLAELGLNAAGGAGAITVVKGCGPLRSLKLRDLGAREVATLARLPAVERLEDLALRGTDATPAAVAALLRMPWAAQLRSLELSHVKLAPVDASVVADLAALTSLNLRFPDDATVYAIADAAFVPHLEKLELHDCRIDAPRAKRLAARGLPVLERLILKHAEISDAALRTLVDAAPRLKELGIPKTTRPQPWAKRGRTVL